MTTSNLSRLPVARPGIGPVHALLALGTALTLLGVSVAALPVALHLALACVLPRRTEGQTIRAIVLLSVTAASAAWAAAGGVVCGDGWALLAASLYLGGLSVLTLRR
ncbi:hypothetical protein [Deinococcus planocerae]|uniref:hypothetical protein n=1 Tax=Deinococcus planocerae TaxID=1737569 RepID=UPI000C7E9B6F|nr:hypothetical protein [Deinococcus planocerae]